MGIVKAVGDWFRSSPKNEATDQYGILSPLLAASDYISTVSSMIKVIKDTPHLKGSKKVPNTYVEKGVQAYKEYVKDLPSHEQSLEKSKPFSVILLTLESIAGNLTQIEDSFQLLFGAIANNKPEQTLKTSSLIVIGYLEKTNNFVTWLSSLVEHLTVDASEMIPPFRSKELLSKAPEMAEFSAFNLNKWNNKKQGLITEIKEMQRKGSDLVVQTDSGQWIDEFASDAQFSPMEKDLITASLRSPIMIALTWGQVRAKDKIDLLTSRKDWLTSKIVLEQSKLRGMDIDSPDYKRLKKATDHYADLVSRYEQKIERMRA